MTGRVSDTLDLAAAIRLSVGDDPTAIVLMGYGEEAEMPEFVKLRRRRLKSETKWPRWLRNPRLLKWAFWIGGMSYRLWRWWQFFAGPTDG